MFACTYACALVLVIGVVTSAGAQETPLSISQVLALARERSPAVIAARARVVEAQAALVGASMRIDNPDLDASAGPRLADGGNRQLDFGVGLSLMFENGKRRRARIAGVEGGRESDQREENHLRSG